MYAKNNLGSLGRIHCNALMKSQSPTSFNSKPLSGIENSLEKLKVKKKKGSKSGSRSKQNTPENDRSVQRRASIGGQKKSGLINNLQQKPKQPLFQRLTRKPASQFSEHINSIVSSYDGSLVRIPSLLSLQSKNLADSATNSCTGSDYQLPMQSQFSQKSVKFSDKHVEINMARINANKPPIKQEDKARTPSILKKRPSHTPSVNSQRSSSIRSSANKLSRARDLIEMENLSASKLTKAKYDALIKKYEDLNKRFNKNLFKNYSKLQKFTDDIFPPQNSSIFSYSIHKKTEQPKQNISWKRIPELYNNCQNLVVLREQQSKSLVKITKKDLKNQPSLAEDHLVIALNCIRENKNLLDKMFEVKEINLFGVYLVKIFCQNQWKYMIIDDLIPVVFDQAREMYVPAFVNVEKAEGNSTETIEIWPYLLEKAFAAYYSKYMALRHGTQIDILAEFVGVPYATHETKQIDFKGKQHLEIQTLLKEEKAIVLGQKTVDGKSTFYCILPDLNSITKKSQGFCTVLSKQKFHYKPTRQKLQTFLPTLTHIHIYSLSPPPNTHLSYLCAESKRSQGSFKSRPPVNSPPKQDPDTVLRCFTIQTPTKAVLSIRQKDCKFYFQGKVEYKYIWIRAVLLLKEHNGDYRWVDGEYSNKKHLTFFLTLQPGEYYLLLMPEWHPAYKYDATISLSTECPAVTLQKRPYLPAQQIFEKGCTDIAQRHGAIHQINKYICAYNFVSQKTGLVIENINNQRESGPVTVMRSINGLKCQVSLVPVNKEFYTVPNSDYCGETVKKVRKTIQLDIEAGQHFTVVLKTVGGIDKKFFDSFDFGS